MIPSLVSRELRLIEDQCLKTILSLTNNSEFPLLVSGTPDGIAALSKRISNVQRFVSSGYHHFPIFEDPQSKAFIAFLNILITYQYVSEPLIFDEGLASLIIELTAGIPRIIIALWIAAHRVAFERKDDDLRFDDFKLAATTYLGPIQPAISALRSKDPHRMRQYEDLMPRDDVFWASFWSSVGSM